MKTSRRSFLHYSIPVLGAAAASNRVLGSNDRIGVGFVGLGGQGHSHLRALAGRKDVRIAGLCDVSRDAVDRAARTVLDAAGATPALADDFRRVLEDRNVDVVFIATPHHWHGPVALAAVQADKDIYVEKPASHVFREGRLLVEAARRHRRIVQHGTQMRSSRVTEEAGQVLKSGILGEIRMAKAWEVQDRGPKQPVPDGEPPVGLDYDRWLGPAPVSPFNTSRFRDWRYYRDYGNGDLGDDGPHDLDLARWGLGVTTHPVRVTAHGSNTVPRGYCEFPDNMFIAYEYADGRVLLYEDRCFVPYGQHGVDSGNGFYGTEGFMIFSRRGYFETYLGRKEERGPSIPRSAGGDRGSAAHLSSFLECVRSRKEPSAGPETAHLSCALIHLGEIAYRTRTTLEFDPVAERILNSARANALLTKEYRSPFGLPKPA